MKHRTEGQGVFQLPLILVPEQDPILTPRRPLGRRVARALRGIR